MIAHRLDLETSILACESYLASRLEHGEEQYSTMNNPKLTRIPAQKADRRRVIKLRGAGKRWLV